MGKKKEGGDKATTAKAVESLAAKKASRRAQSERDRAAALKVKGYRPSTKLSNIQRCEKCERPSARVRNGESDKCARCSRGKKVLKAPQVQEPGPAFISPDAAAIIRQAVTA